MSQKITPQMITAVVAVLISALVALPVLFDGGSGQELETTELTVRLHQEEADLRRAEDGLRPIVPAHAAARSLNPFNLRPVTQRVERVLPPPPPPPVAYPEPLTLPLAAE